MRSRTEPDLPGRCPRCWVREGWCVCKHLEPTDSRIEVVIIRHHFEAWRASGTARIAELALHRCRIVPANPPYNHADQAIAGLHAAWLLFPGGAPAERLGPIPKRLVVLDGSWREVRRLHRRLPALWTLPRYTLPTKETTPLRLRHSAGAQQRSTLEAIADAIAELEGPEIAAPLHALHERFVEQSLRARGAWSYRAR